jgi:hypothetical protein
LTKEKSEKCQRVSVADAAKEIGCHPEYLRRKMAAKDWDLGRVVTPKNKGGQHEYFIFRTKLDKFLGIERREESENNEKVI